MNDDTDWLSVLVDRLRDPDAIAAAIASARQRLRLLEAIAAVLARDRVPRDLKVRRRPEVAPEVHPEPVAGSEERVRCRRRDHDALRRAAAIVLAAEGPMGSAALAGRLDCPASTVYLFMDDHPWFARAAGKFELTSDGHREAVPPKEDI